MWCRRGVTGQIRCATMLARARPPDPDERPALVMMSREGCPVTAPWSEPAGDASGGSPALPDVEPDRMGPVTIRVLDGVVVEFRAPTIDESAVVGRPFGSLVHPDD